jgi:UDP-N-acetyl-D-mannosaminuronic acid transferase (WecB/TagA/CpsF family)
MSYPVSDKSAYMSHRTRAKIQHLPWPFSIIIKEGSAMKNYPLQPNVLVPSCASFTGLPGAAGRSSECLREFMAAACPAPDHFAYGLIASVRSLVRYHEDADYRRYLRNAEVILPASWAAAWLIQQLQGVRLPVCSAAQVADLMLELSRPTDRILRVGSAPGWRASARARRLKDIRCHSHDEVQGCIEFIEASAPFRFCLLTMGSPRQELIAHEVFLNERALGLIFCVGPS